MVYIKPGHEAIRKYYEIRTEIQEKQEMNEGIETKYDLSKELYTSDDLVAFIKRSKTMVYIYYKKGILGRPVDRFSKNLLWDKATVIAFLDQFERRRYATNPTRRKGQRTPRKEYRKEYTQLSLLTEDSSTT